MIRLFVTGDNHIGRKYDRYPDIREQLIQSRFESMRDMVDQAERERCDLFVVTGDLFDNIGTIKKKDVKLVVEILGRFSGTVLVLPGNHDYYTGEETVWRDFEDVLSGRDHNMILLKECREYPLEIGEEQVVVYPAPCDSKHSAENRLGWIRQAGLQQADVYRIGIAHGAIQGLSPDRKNEYFRMTESELMSIPMDVWLIGHTHIPYPPQLKEEEDMSGFRIFNAGTHEQTDLHNHTEGSCFIITLDKKGTSTDVRAHKYVSGRIHYADLVVEVCPDSSTALRDALTECLRTVDPNTVVRIRVSGRVSRAEYLGKEALYQEILGKYLSYEKVDTELSEEITTQKIREEFAETSFAALLMEALLDNPTELQMAYELLQHCREN